MTRVPATRQSGGLGLAEQLVGGDHGGHPAMVARTGAATVRIRLGQATVNSGAMRWIRIRTLWSR